MLCSGERYRVSRFIRTGAALLNRLVKHNSAITAETRTRPKILYGVRSIWTIYGAKVAMESEVERETALYPPSLTPFLLQGTYVPHATRIIECACTYAAITKR